MEARELRRARGVPSGDTSLGTSSLKEALSHDRDDLSESSAEPQLYCRKKCVHCGQGRRRRANDGHSFCFRLEPVEGRPQTEGLRTSASCLTRPLKEVSSGLERGERAQPLNWAPHTSLAALGLLSQLTPRPGPSRGAETRPTLSSDGAKPRMQVPCPSPQAALPRRERPTRGRPASPRTSSCMRRPEAQGTSDGSLHVLRGFSEHKVRTRIRTIKSFKKSK